MIARAGGNHVRFWAQSSSDVQTVDFWLNTDRPDELERALWVGAGTRDTGFSLTQLTFQITHATDSDTNAERDYIINELTKSQVIRHATLYKAGDTLPAHVNHYVTDGDIAVAEIQSPSA